MVSIPNFGINMAEIPERGPERCEKRGPKVDPDASCRPFMLVRIPPINRRTPAIFVIIKTGELGGSSVPGEKYDFHKLDKTIMKGMIEMISDDPYFLIDQLQVMSADERKRLMKENAHQNPPLKKRKVEEVDDNEPSTSQHFTMPNRVSVISQSSPAATNPPMTFCQQTQTDFTDTWNGLTDCVMAEAVNTLQIEMQEVKHDLAENKEKINDVQAKIGQLNNLNGSINDDNVVMTPKAAPIPTTSSIIPYGQPKILNLSLASNVSRASPTSFNGSTILDAIEVSNDSIYSYSTNSRMSLNASNQSIYDNGSPITSSADNSHSENRLTIQSMKIERLGDVQSIGRDVSPDDEGNPDEEVSIGLNNTKVQRHVLSNINWNSHTAATRRLLRAKFTREVLATHSLTGKPSPGKMILIVYPQNVHFIPICENMY